MPTPYAFTHAATPRRHAPAFLAAFAVLFLSGALVAQDAPVKKDVPYVPTPQEMVDRMLEMAKVTDRDVVYDLGCGDGRMVITAAKKYGARGVGVDIDPQRIAESNANAKKAGVADKVKFIKQDLFQMDFNDATVLALYLLPDVNEKLRPKILRLKPGTRLVSHAFRMGDWEPDDTQTVEGRTAYYWTVPAKVEGQWQATLTEGGQKRQATLDLRQKYQKVTGTAEIDGKRAEIKEAQLRGDQLTIALGGENGAKTYTVSVDGATMQPVAQRQGESKADADQAQTASFTAKRQGGAESGRGESRHGKSQQGERDGGGGRGQQQERQPAGAGTN